MYNVEAYLDRCVDSILSQSYQNIELILVDDGSTDGSSVKCDEWANKDSRVVVVHKVNGGVSSARNKGLELINGDYITFVDPDDFLAPETYNPNMGYLLCHPNVDVLQYPYCNYTTDKGIMGCHKPSSALFVGVEHIFRNWWSGTPLEYVIWNKIYKSKVWRGVCFEENRTSEDTCLVPKLVMNSESVYISEQGLYYYQRGRADSYTYHYNYEKHIDLFHAHATIYDCFDMFPNMVTEKVLAFTRLYRRLIVAKQVNPVANISGYLDLIEKKFPSWQEIYSSHGTEKLWLSISKLLGANLFVKLFLRYLKL